MLFLIRLLIIWWILTILFKWLGRLLPPRQESSDGVKPGDALDKGEGFVQSGKIEDADFEELDE